MLKSQFHRVGGHFRGAGYTTRPRITATTDGDGVVSHAGSRLLADVADRTTLTGGLAQVLAGLRRPRARHDPGRVLVDMAVAVADGARTISDIAVLADQAELFGAVASDSTRWRLLELLDGTRLDAVAQARAAAREVVWAQRAELSGQMFPSARAAGRVLPGLVIDLDASVVVCHSEKEQAAPTFKRTFGYHPMLAFCDNTGEFLAATLRRGTRAATPPPTTSDAGPRGGAGSSPSPRSVCGSPTPNWRCRTRPAPVQRASCAPSRVRWRPTG